MLKAAKLLALSVAFLLLSHAVACAAGTDLVKLIPEDALGFVVINNLAEADAKLQQTAKRLQVPMAGAQGAIKALAGIEKGFDQKGAVGLAGVPGGDDAPLPTPVLYVPVTDYAAFVGQLGADDPAEPIVEVDFFNKPVAIGHKANYAVIVPTEHQAVLKQVLGPVDSIAPAVKDLKDYLAKQDAAAVITSGGVKFITAAAEKGLNQFKEILRANEATAMQADAMDIYTLFLKAMSDEADRVALGVRLDGDGNLRLSKRVRFNPSGSVAPLLKDARPHQGDLLAGLPAGEYLFALGGITPVEAYEPLMEFSRELLKSQHKLYGIPPEKVDELLELSMDSVTQLKEMSFVLGIGEEDQPLYSNMVGVMRVKNADTYLDEYRKSIEKMAQLAGDDQESVLGGMKVDTVRIDGSEGLKLVMKMPIPGLEENEEFKALMEKMYGPGATMTAYLAAADKRTVALAYTSAESLQRVLQTVKSGQAGLSADEGITETAKLLPRGAQWVGYWSASGTFAFANRMFAMMKDITGQSLDLPEFPKSPPVGFAAVASPEGLEAEMVVPAKLVDAIGEYVKTVEQMQAAPAAEPL
jgi:hypothetical protein